MLETTLKESESCGIDRDRRNDVGSWKRNRRLDCSGNNCELCSSPMTPRNRNHREICDCGNENQALRGLYRSRIMAHQLWAARVWFWFGKFDWGFQKGRGRKIVTIPLRYSYYGRERSAWKSALWKLGSGLTCQYCVDAFLRIIFRGAKSRHEDNLSGWEDGAVGSFDLLRQLDEND